MAQAKTAPVQREPLDKQETGRQLRRLAEKLDRVPSYQDVHEAWRAGDVPHPRRIANDYGGYTKALKEHQVYQMVALEKLIRLAEELGRRPSYTELENASRAGKCPTRRFYIRYFGTLENAFQAADIAPNSRPSKSSLLQQLRQLAEEIGGRPTVNDIAEGARRGVCVGPTVLRNLFGSLGEALRLARVDELEVVILQKRRRIQVRDLRRAKASKAHWAKRREAEQVLAKQQLVELAIRHNHIATRRLVNADYRQGLCLSGWAMERLFGSFPAAVEASGARQALAIVRLQRLAEKLGRQPTLPDINAASRSGESFSGYTLRRWFGSYGAAIKAAGFTPPKSRAYKTDWQLSRELGVIAAEIGRTPTSRDIELGCQAGRCAHRDTYIRRFGSISEANRAAGLLS